MTVGSLKMPVASLIAGVVAGVALKPDVVLGGHGSGEVLSVGLGVALAGAGGYLAWTRSRRWRRRLTDGLFRARRLGAWRLRCAARRHLAGARGAFLLWALIAGAVGGLALYGLVGGAAFAATWHDAMDLAAAVLSPWVAIAAAAGGAGMYLGRRGWSLGQGRWGAHWLAGRVLKGVAILALIAFLISAFGDNVRAMFGSSFPSCSDTAEACL